MKTLPHRLLSGIKAYGADLYCNLESKFKITEGQLIHAISSTRYCNLVSNFSDKIKVTSLSLGEQASCLFGVAEVSVHRQDAYAPSAIDVAFSPRYVAFLGFSLP